MRILLTGANGYIGLRLLPQLLELGHEVICAVRDKNRLAVNKELRKKIEVVEIDFLEKPVIPESIKNIEIVIDDNWIQVIDNGMWMNSYDLSTKLLFPNDTSKSRKQPN